jgi:K+-sensing histidine kinase KdpD
MRSGQSQLRSFLLRYGVAVLSTGAIVGIKLLLPQSLREEAPFLLVVVTAVVSAWFGGVGPGLVAAMLGTGAVNWFLLPPQGQLTTDPRLIFHSFADAIQSAGAAILMGYVQSSRMRAEDAARRVQGVYTVASALGGTRSLQEIADVILHETVTVLNAGGVAIFETSKEDGSLRLTAHIGNDPRYLPLLDLPEIREVPIGSERPAALAARTRTLVFIESPEELNRRFPDIVAVAQGRPIPGALICAPMVVHDQVVGILDIGFARPRRLGSDDRAWAQTLAQDCGTAIERRRLLDEERRARIQATEASKAKDVFLGIVSAELRAPLTTIIGWAHVLKQHKRDSARYEHGLDIIERSAQAQARLVDDILDMSRIAARRLKVEGKTLELPPLIKTCVEDVRVMSASKGVDLELEHMTSATVVGDSDRLREAICKVLSNAFRFTPPGGHIHVNMEVRQRRVFVVVEDDAKGPVPEQLAKAMTEFQKGDWGTGAREGSLGLALAIANYIVREHRGTLRLESAGDDGKGTRVTIELPLAEPTAGVMEVQGKGARGDDKRGRPAPRLSGMRVLVIEDDTDEREVLAEMLAAEGANVATAISTSEAYEQVKEFEPDVVVYDVAVHDADGGAFAREITNRGAPKGPIPTLALTAHDRPEERQTAKQAGYRECLTKPPEPRVLTETIARLGAPRH